MTERPAPATVLPSLSTIPTIDFSRLAEGNKDKYKSEMLELTRACEEWGFFSGTS
jgi:isopenicillin N synthase-like dioxygenase